MAGRRLRLSCDAAHRLAGNRRVHTDEKPLEMQLSRDSESELALQGVVVRGERPRIRAASLRLRRVG